MSPNPQLFAQFLVPSFPTVPTPHVSSSLVISHYPHCPITPPRAVILTITYVLCPKNTQFPHPLLPPTHFHNQLQNLTDLSKPPFSSSLLIHHQVLGSAPWESVQDLLSQEHLLRCPTQRPPLAILQATAAPAQSQPRGHTSPHHGLPSGALAPPATPTEPSLCTQRLTSMQTRSGTCHVQGPGDGR